MQECTQPQGHSTSGSHERYKSKERLQWEKEMDCNKKMAEWMVKEGILTQKEVDAIQEWAKVVYGVWKSFVGKIQLTI